MEIDSEGAIIRAMKEEVPLEPQVCPHRRQVFRRELESFVCIACETITDKLSEVRPSQGNTDGTRSL